ncbi:MAG: major capsid protein P2 [Candidatus Aquirickettsiella gammari]
MFNKPLLQVVGVAPSSVATLRIPAEQATLVGVKLNFGGTTMADTNVSRVKLKIGPRTIWDLTGAQLRAINAYKNGAANSKYMWIDFTERDQAGFPLKEIGGIDLMAVLHIGEVYLEITIDGAAVAPTITAQGYFNQSQGNGAIVKFVPFSFTQSAAGRFTLPLSLRGAMMKRIWAFYSGTNGTAGANGNLSRLECKKNGLVFFDQMDLDARFDATQFKKVPQANLFVADYIVDNNHHANIATMRQVQNGQLVYDSFEFNAYLTDAGGATVNVIAEVLDSVTNL